MKRRFGSISLCLALLALGAQGDRALAQAMLSESDQPVAQGSDNRNRAKVHTELASLYLQGGNLAVALEECRIAISADSNYAPAYNVRALTYVYLREFGDAEKDFLHAMSLAPNDPDVNNNYGWYLCQRGRENEAITLFLNALKNPLYSTPDRALTNAGACALKKGDLEGAEDYLQKAIRLARDGAPAAQVQMAILAYRQGNYQEARRRFREVSKVVPQPSAELLWLGIRIEHKLGNQSEADSLVSQLRRLYVTSNEYQEFLKGNYE